MALPSWGWKWPEAKALLGGAHLLLTWILTVLVALHLAGAAAHLARRDGMFQRMWPKWRNA